MELPFHASTLDVTLFRTYFMSKLKALYTFKVNAWMCCCQGTSYDMFLTTKQTPFHFLSNFKSQEYER